jgi:hypothetical protein
MLAASFNLVYEGFSYGEPLSCGNARAVAGLLLGLALIVASRWERTRRALCHALAVRALLERPSSAAHRPETLPAPAGAPS